MKNELSEERLIPHDLVLLANNIGLDVSKHTMLSELKQDPNWYREQNKHLSKHVWYYNITLSSLQTWIRDNYNINIFVGFKLNIKKWTAESYSMELSGYEFAKKFPLNTKRPHYDSYEEALLQGLIDSINLIKEENNGK